MRVLIVTGTPGTGKTTLAKTLAKEKNYQFVNVGLLIERNRLYEREDKRRKTKIVDLNKLIPYLESYIKRKKGEKKKGIVIDSHLSHYLPASVVDQCYVTTCDLKILKQRLKKRGYSTLKVKENLEAEVFDTCLIEAQENGHKIKHIDTSG